MEPRQTEQFAEALLGVIKTANNASSISDTELVGQVVQLIDVIRNNKAEPEEYSTKSFASDDAEDSLDSDIDIAMDVDTAMDEIAEPSSGNKIRDIRIEEVHRGYIVKIGCHTFAISTHTELSEKLAAYLANPSETESKWFKGELF